MKRLMIAMLAVGLAATAFLVSAQASTPKLVGKVGPDFSITLKKGTWKYYCSVHESLMFGFFKVTS